MSKAGSRESIQTQVLNTSGKLAKYRRTMVGDGGNVMLLLHEMISFVVIPMKWFPGFFLRKWMLKILIGKMGRSVRIGANCCIRNGKRIFIGDFVEIGNEVSLDVKPGKNTLVLEKYSSIGKRTILNCAGGEMSIGAGTTIGSYSRLGSLKGLAIGRDTRIGEKCCIVGAGHATSDPNKPIIAQPITCNGPTSIGDSVVVGKKVTILDGVQIGSFAVIDDNSYVNRDIPSGGVASGIPAKVRNIHSSAN